MSIAAEIAVCLAPAVRWTDVDPLSGEVHQGEGASAMSAADAAALEVALTIADRWQGSVTAVTVGPAEAEPLLRDALACGAARALRIDVEEPGRPAEVASALADAVRGAVLVCCGDQGAAFGSGAVPAFLGAELGRAAALGLVDVTIGEAGRPLSAVRRLDGGRREHLLVDTPAIISVEGGAARLRRASLPGLLRAGRAVIEVLTAHAPLGPSATLRSGVPRPYRPRPRAVPAPAGGTLDRVRALAGVATGGREGRRAVVTDPQDAARLVYEALERWGYLAERAGR
jgi:electron transfer flavoprotein beta subunit